VFIDSTRRGTGTQTWRRRHGDPGQRLAEDAIKWFCLLFLVCLLNVVMLYMVRNGRPSGFRTELGTIPRGVHWKAETDWCSTIADSVAYGRTSEVFPAIATRPDSDFRLQCMHTTTS
jgi:hypothetical protein